MSFIYKHGLFTREMAKTIGYLYQHLIVRPEYRSNRGSSDTIFLVSNEYRHQVFALSRKDHCRIGITIDPCVACTWNPEGQGTIAVEMYELN
jgi:hypothetical protein